MTTNQMGFDFTPAAANCAATRLYAECLGPEAVVSLSCTSLSVSDMEILDYLRARMTPEQLSHELKAISDVAKERETFGDFALLGLKPMASAYGSVYSASSELNWMHEHERKRAYQLQQAMPTSAELQEEARDRIQQRIAARRARHQQSAA